MTVIAEGILHEVPDDIKMALKKEKSNPAAGLAARIADPKHRNGLKNLMNEYNSRTQ